MTLPRLNWVLTGLATLEMEERFRRVERAVDWRSRVVDILGQFESFTLDGGGQLCDDKDVEEKDVQQLEALSETSSPAGESLRSCALAAAAPTCSSLYISRVHDHAIELWYCILPLKTFTST